MNISELETRMDMAYLELKVAIEKYRNQAERVRQLEYKLKSRIVDAYAQGRISGKNTTEREAAERSIFAVELDELENEKQDEAFAYRDKELAEIEVRYLHDILRIKELADVQ